MGDDPKNTEAPKNSEEGRAKRALRKAQTALRWLGLIDDPDYSGNSADPAAPEKGRHRRGALAAGAATESYFVPPDCERGTCLAHRGEHVQWEDCEQWTPSLQAGRLGLPESAAQLEPPAAAEERERAAASLDQAWLRVPGPPPEMWVRTEHGDVPMEAWLAEHPERPEAFRLFREAFSDLRPVVIEGSAEAIRRLSATPLCAEQFEVSPELREAARHPSRDHWCCRLSGHAGVHLCTCGMEWRPARPSAGDGLMAIRHSLALVEIAGLHRETRYAPPGWIGEPQRRCAEDHKPWPCPTSLLCQQAAQAPGIPGAGPEAALAKDPT